MLLRATVQCSAGKGFGDRAGKDACKGGKRKEVAGVKSGDAKVRQCMSGAQLCCMQCGEQHRRLRGEAAIPPRPSIDTQAVQRAVRLVEEQEGRGRGRGAAGARPVDPREARRGKVEYVRVSCQPSVIKRLVCAR